MAENKIDHNVECQSNDHEKHLCFLMCEGYHYSNPQEYKEIVQNANFRCENCGRTANKDSQLCKPISL